MGQISVALKRHFIIGNNMNFDYAWQKGCPDGESALLMRKLYATMSKLFVTVRGHVAGMLAPREVIVNSS